MIRSEIKKLQHNINREAAKILALSSGKIVKFYMRRNPDQGRVIKRAKFYHSSTGINFERQIKMIENQGEKQIKTVEVHRKPVPEFNAFIK